jgi:hypothetical protein
VPEQVFDEVVFGDLLANRPTPRERLMADLEEESRAIAGHCSLTIAQRRKIELAGRGDIKDWIDRAEHLRAILTSDSGKPMREAEEAEFDQLVREMQVLQAERESGLFGASSFFRKALLHSLTPQQRDALDAFDRDRRVGVIDRVLTSSPTPANLLSHRGQKRVTSYLANKCPDMPLKGPWPWYIVFLQADEHSKELQKMLSDDDWQFLNAQVTRARKAERELRILCVWPRKAAGDE